MISEERVKLLNTLHSKITDWDADGECLYYVYIALDDEVKSVLNQLGYDNKDIEMMVEDWDGEGNEYIDLAPIGFDGSVDWWDSDNGFSIVE